MIRRFLRLDLRWLCFLDRGAAHCWQVLAFACFTSTERDAVNQPINSTHKLILWLGSFFTFCVILEQALLRKGVVQLELSPTTHLSRLLLAKAEVTQVSFLLLSPVRLLEFPSSSELLLALPSVVFVRRDVETVVVVTVAVKVIVQHHLLVLVGKVSDCDTELWGVNWAIVHSIRSSTFVVETLRKNLNYIRARHMRFRSRLSHYAHQRIP